MTIERPDLARLRAIAATHGLTIPDADLLQYDTALQGFLDSCDLVEVLHAAETAPVPDRPWKRPTAEENPLGAWSVQTDVRASLEAGPLKGKRMAIKDSVSVAGVPMMAGSRMLEGFIPSRDASVVTRLVEAGAVICGKSVCEDLCMSAGSHTSRPGPVLNPWDPSRSAGGSSSGSGVLVATGEVDMAVSGDQGGSIRIPASLLGIVGHKPTWGLVPYTGAVPVEQSLDHVGPTARSVADVARLLTVMAGVDGLDPRQPHRLPEVDYLSASAESPAGLRIGVVTQGFGHPTSEPEVDETVRAKVDDLRALGVEVQDVSIDWHLLAPALFAIIATEGGLNQLVEGNTYGATWKGHYDPELVAFFGERRRSEPDELAASVKLTILGGGHAKDVAHGRHYAMARNLERSLAAAYDTALRSFDVLVMPTTPMRATPLPQPDAQVAEVLARGTEMLTNTCAFNVTGHPACSVPAGVVDGLPVGMMVVGRRFDDATVLRVAQAVESLTGEFAALPSSQA